MDCTYSAQQNMIHLACPELMERTFSMNWPQTILVMIVGVGLIFLISGIIRGSFRIASQWNRAIILRLGKFHRVAGPGLFFKIPGIDKIAEWVTLQIQVTPIAAERTLTKDTVPINVRAVMTWRVTDPRAAVVEVADYEKAVDMACQVALREVIGASDFTELLSERVRIDVHLAEILAKKTATWGIEVTSVDIQDVQIPSELEEAMSREAQAERERHARVILGQSEVEIAAKFAAAAEVYAKSPGAMQLRAMNIIYETTKERGATILLPTTMIDALSSVGVATALVKASLPESES